jgi:arginine-tRNA-protein transferase
MFADRHFPDNLNHWQLDQYLEKGWYRMGQIIFTTQFLIFGTELYSALWLRLPLQNYQFRGTNRKLFHKVSTQFQVFTRRALINEEKDHLYALYAENFNGNLAANLTDMLFEASDESIFDTWEIAVYDGETLIACSFFDRGFKSIASIFAMYHPDYEKNSLGYFTMLAEIDYALNYGYVYFYPGYVTPGYRRFDYKLRIGEVEYFDLKTEKWLDYQQLNPEKIPIHQIKGKMNSLMDYFLANKILLKKMYYTFFEINLVSLGFLDKSDYLEYPLILMVPNTQFVMISFDPRTELFHLMKCKDLFENQQFPLEHIPSVYDEDQFFNSLVSIESILESSPNIPTIFNAVLSVLSRP